MAKKKKLKQETKESIALKKMRAIGPFRRHRLQFILET